MDRVQKLKFKFKGFHLLVKNKKIKKKNVTMYLYNDQLCDDDWMMGQDRGGNEIDEGDRLVK